MNRFMCTKETVYKISSLFDNIVKDEENEIDLDVPAMIVDESTMIPLRAVSEALGAKVEWNQQSNTVSLNI